MHTLTDDGTRLFLSRMGDRGSPPLILAHGTFSNQRSCAPLASHLAARGWHFYKFIGDDGYRLMTSWSTTDVEIDAFLADARALVK